MLAMPTAPFDSQACSFEVTWNSIRALVILETASRRLRGKERAV
jgi:hypothetical protein